MPKIKCNCAICDKIFYRDKSHIKSKNVFCSRKHKEKGMMLGLVAPMRLGTGYGVDDILRRRKYYKYKAFDRKHNYKSIILNVREFCQLLKTGKCYYCGNNINLGFDRINHQDGHHINNVIIACHICNMTRGRRFTVDQMKQIGAVISSFYRGGEE